MDQDQADLARAHFLVHSVLLGTMDVEHLVDVLEIIDGIIGGDVQSNDDVSMEEVPADTFA